LTDAFWSLRASEEEKIEGGKKMKPILIVEDEAIMRESLQDWLTTFGYQVETAKEGKEALKIIAKRDFGVAILDLKLPGKDGLEVLHDARVKRPQLKGIIITAYPSIGTAVEVMKEGAVDYLPKSFDLNELEKLIRDTLGSVQVEIKARAVTMATMRKEGYSLQIIGETFGITRERVRQILNKHYHGNKLANKKYCIHCGKLTQVNIKYCPECSEAYRKYPYPFFTPEAKKRHMEHTKAWQKRNPELAREIQNRALARCLERRKQRHYDETKYIVVKKNSTFPIGTQFKAVGCVNSYLVLEGGSKIPNLCVRKSH